MSKTIWKIYIKYDDGWWPVRWAPFFATKEEADEWISGDHDWDGWVQAEEEEIDDDDYIYIFEDELENDGEHE